MESNDYLLKTPVKKLLIKFAVPCIISLLVGALYNIVDQIFIGNSGAGTAGVMATTLVYPFTVFALAVALLLGDGTAALYSITLGEKKEQIAKKCVSLGICSLLLSGVILMLLGFIFKPEILNFLGASGYSAECQAYASEYMTIILAGIPFSVFVSGATALIRASGAPTYSTLSTVIGAVINLVFDPIMIFAMGLGVRGAAIATIAGQIVSALFAFRYFVNPPRGKRKKDAESTLTSELVKLDAKSFTFKKQDQKIFLRSLKLGLTSFITQFAVVVITVVANNVVGSVGGEHATDAGGALGIVFKVFGIVISFSVGLAVGGQPIIGFNYGARRQDRVRETFKYILLGNLLIGLIATLLFEFAPSLIVKLFGENALDLTFYRDFAAASFRIYLGGILFCCLSKASSIFLQSIERPFKAMFISFMRDVIVLVPAVIILGNQGGLYGLLWAGPLADGLTAILTVALLFPELKSLKKTSY